MLDKSREYPELRFQGFSGVWEKRKLGEISQIVMGQSPNSINYTNNPTDHILVQGNADMKNGQVVPRVWTKQVTKEANVGDLVLSVRAPVGDIGKTNYSIVLGRGVAGIRGNDFVYQSLIKMKAIGYWNKFSTGSTFDSINSSDIKSAEIIVPKREEQARIGSFFKSLDNLITVNQRKLNELKKLKKAYLQKMFPKNGASIPELRFAGFKTVWEKRKLGDIATFVNGRAYKQKELLDSGKYPVLRVGNFYTNDSWYYSDLELPEKNYASKGDLLYTWSATFGPHIWEGEKAIFHYHIWKVELSNSLYKDFILQILESDKNKLLNKTNGSAMFHLTKEEMEKKEISIPTLNEQTQIGSFLKSLDNLITVNQRKLDKLKELKKGYLQKMFI